jgi:hypothetical protein
MSCLMDVLYISRPSLVLPASSSVALDPRFKYFPPQLHGPISAIEITDAEIRTGRIETFKICKEVIITRMGLLSLRLKDNYMMRYRTMQVKRINNGELIK